jgi:hypothetical protein
MPDEWFRPTPTTPVYLFLYRRGTLFENRPPAADPAMYQGVVTTFNWSNNPITGQRVDCEIANLHRPVLGGVPSGNMPRPATGVVAQVVAHLRHQGDFPLPIYSKDKGRPRVRVQALFEDVAGELMSDSLPVPASIAEYYTPDSVHAGRFVFRRPRPARTVTIQVPGGGFYRQDPERTVRASIARRDESIEPKVETDKLPPPYFYRVRFVFNPEGQGSLFD